MVCPCLAFKWCVNGLNDRLGEQCHIFMYDGKDKNTNSQTNILTKYILNIYGCVMQNKIYCN